MMRIFSFLIGAAFLGAMPAMTAPVSAEKLSPDRHRVAHDMFEHLVNIPTVFGRGKVPTLANYLADQYRAVGFPAGDVQVIPYDSTDPIGQVTDKTAALIVRWRAPGKARGKPIMLMGHMDVVEAKREDSTTDPFVLTERDGYYYGRGSIDMKDGIVGIKPTASVLTRARPSGRRTSMSNMA
jgi:acetylornithine deacetylase/succinyl-diaminopimelate desuccinylase-like protein